MVPLLTTVILTASLVSVRTDATAGAQRELTYTTRDGWTIHASFVAALKPKRPLLISIHMLMSDRSYYPARRALTREFNLLKIDMRGHGDSKLYRGKQTHWRSGRGNMYWGSFNDIRKGIEVVARLYGDAVDTTRVFMQGSSYSCVLILQYFLKNPKNIRGLIFMSPGNSYGQSIVKVYAGMLAGARRVPVYHVCSKKDFYCYKHTLAIQRQLTWKLKRTKARDLRLTRFAIEDEHVHGTHFFYTHPDTYPSAQVTWMNSVMEK